MKDRDYGRQAQVLALIESEPDIWLRMGEIHVNGSWHIIMFDMVSGRNRPTGKSKHGNTTRLALHR